MEILTGILIDEPGTILILPVKIYNLNWILPEEEDYRENILADVALKRASHMTEKK